MRGTPAGALPSVARALGFALRTGGVVMQLIWRRAFSLCFPLGVLGGVLALFTSPAEAHVKWFCGAVDVTRPPLALAAVLSPTLLVLGAAAMTLVSAGGGLDTLALRRWPSLLRQGARSEIIEEALIRFGVGSYMLLCMASCPQL